VITGRLAGQASTGRPRGAGSAIGPVMPYLAAPLRRRR
jgi:hypothetical protein